MPVITVRGRDTDFPSAFIDCDDCALTRQQCSSSTCIPVGAAQEKTMFQNLIWTRLSKSAHFRPMTLRPGMDKGCMIKPQSALSNLGCCTLDAVQGPEKPNRSCHLNCHSHGYSVSVLEFVVTELMWF